jgi:hypothetical protein
MRSPFWQQQAAEEKKIKDKEELDELNEMTQEAFRDPM